VKQSRDAYIGDEGSTTTPRQRHVVHGVSTRGCARV
jgi:hypothetical protein